MSALIDALRDMPMHATVHMKNVVALPPVGGIRNNYALR
jgi:hypothetical protein